jgi:AraC-like DNA-binding protein
MDGARPRVQRHASPLGEWEMASAAPGPHLRGEVLRYCGYRERTPGPLRRREAATSVVPLILSFEHPIRVLDPERGERAEPVAVSFAAGVWAKPAVTEHAGEQHGVQIDLSPQAARRLLGVPMHELAGRAVALEDLLGRRGTELVARLAEKPTWEARFALLDAELGRRLAATPAPPPGLDYAVGRLRRAHGAVAIGALAAESGWSRRALLDRFREHVGLGPKGLARVLRFERVLALAGAGEAGLADAAYAAGYADQAHLNPDFRALAGVTPTRYLADRLPDGAGVRA